MITKPPPTPSRPDSNPDIKPVNASARAQGRVQRKRPCNGLSTQGSMKRCASLASPRNSRAALRQMRRQAYTSTPANTSASGVLGTRCASIRPNGVAAMPISAMNNAAR
jgi:hypothetical protein